MTCRSASKRARHWLCWGPNGAGKTTLIRVLTTLLQADSGHVRVAGLDVQKDARVIRSVIGLAGQYATVDELLTGRENLKLMGLLYHLDKAVYRRCARDALKRMSLTGAGTIGSRPTRAACAAGGSPRVPCDSRQPATGG